MLIFSKVMNTINTIVNGMPDMVESILDLRKEIICITVGNYY